MSKKLTPALERDVLARAAGGESADAIAVWLKKAHKVVISGRALRNRLRATREERSEVVKAVVREKLAPMVASDLDHLERIRTEIAEDRVLARGLITKLAKGEATTEAEAGSWDVREAMVWSKQYVKLTELELKAVDRKLHYAGADAPDDPNAELASAAERLDSRLDRLAPSPGETEAAAGARAEPDGSAGA